MLWRSAFPNSRLPGQQCVHLCRWNLGPGDLSQPTCERTNFVLS